MAQTRQETQRKHREKMIAEGRCVQCGKPSDRPGNTRCSACKERKRIQINANRKACTERGMCPRCGKVKLWGDEKACVECMAKDYAYKIPYREKNRERLNEYHNEMMRRKTVERREQGICTRCGKRKADANYTSCQYCRAKKNEYLRDKRSIARAERIQLGLCYFCGKPAIKDKKVCEVCVERMHIMTQKSLESPNRYRQPILYGRMIQN